MGALSFLFKKYLAFAFFWIGVFLSARLIFLVANFDNAKHVTFADYLLMLVYGLHMDMSMVGYISAIVGLLFIVSGWISPSVSKKVSRVAVVVLLTLVGIIVVSDCTLFKYWGFRMDATPLMYLKNPSEVYATMSVWQLIMGPLLVVLFVLFWMWIYSRLIYRKAAVEARLPWWSILLISLNIIPIRGGFGIAPMNPGKAYFSKDNFTNQATVNVVFNVFYSLNKLKDTEKAYHFMDDSEAKAIVDSLYRQSGETEYLLKTRRPNVLVVIMESFVSSINHTLGGVQGITPNLDSLMKEGILFSHIYNDGQRSEKGLVSVMSGYPAQTTTSIIKHNAKVLKLPVLPRDFKKLGYKTAYFHGGDIGFANMRTYLMSSSFDYIITQDDFPKNQQQSKWGAQDGFVFNRLLDSINVTKGPFFYSFFTLSSHEPFDVPMKTVIKGNDDISKFANSAYYTDMCLGNFIRQAKKSKWWDNTLIILIADHGRSFFKHDAINDDLRNQIPMVWLGGALNVKGKRVDNIGVQHDLAATLLAQLNMDHSAYKFSRNLLDKQAKSFGMFTFNNGFGYSEAGSVVVFDNVGNRYSLEKNPNDEVKRRGKALFQVYNRHFLNL